MVESAHTVWSGGLLPLGGPTELIPVPASSPKYPLLVYHLASGMVHIKKPLQLKKWWQQVSFLII